MEDWRAAHAEVAFRYPILLILGPSYAGKTQFAMSIFERPLVLRVGASLTFPDGLRRWTKGSGYDGIVLDDVRNLDFVTLQQDTLQSCNMIQEFGRSGTGMYCFYRNLFQVPFVLTVNWTTQGLKKLLTDDFMKKATNVQLLRYPPPIVQSTCGLIPFSYPDDMCPELRSGLEARFMQI